MNASPKLSLAKETLQSLATHSLPNPENLMLMQIHETDSLFVFPQENLPDTTLPVGFASISKRYFYHTPPTYDEIEYAINDIEDQIETLAPRLRNLPLVVISDTPFIHEIARLCSLAAAQPMILSQEALEFLFGQYAEIAMGRPPRAHEPDISPVFYAQLLILREYLHHLSIEQLLIFQSAK